MADGTLSIHVPGSGGVPEDYEVSGAASIDVLSCKADFDGSGAAVDFVPCVQFLNQAGEIMAQTIGDTVAAGGSATVTFAPFLRGRQASGPSGSTANQKMAMFESIGINQTRQVTCFPDSGAALFSTGLISPVCLIAGVYTITTSVFISGSFAVGQNFNTTLLLGANTANVMSVARQDPKNGTASFSVQDTITGTWAFQAGDTFELYYTNNGSPGHDYSGSIYIQTV